MSREHDKIQVFRDLMKQDAIGPRQTAPLRYPDDVGTLQSMDPTVVDAKIEAAEARIDTKFAELRGDLKDFATKGTVWGAVATAIVSILGVLLAVLAFGGDRFDGGIGLADQRQAQLQKDQRQDDAANAVDAKLDLILAGQASAKGTGAKRP